ncbi:MULTISPECIES: hypothetical protein [Cytobacillus]|uniref:Uncharacterized protein n=1 Tax=Cytobacillus oceanisediminis TaxID=665099 RepID=A0ABX3CNB1_9BACI|nr:hypothetical protein [Cytobacillus oceanisediminis]EFV74946.1 hypothetical protein HMPREF1013_04823 [Bacillus sp. 2_A_57_CT2]OHX44567.1 hypothetical protein BBV17_25415 [Cytobacillus oceanisediminis]
MDFHKGEKITIVLRGNIKPIHATFLAWMPSLEAEDQVYLLVECKGQQRRIHDMFIGKINGKTFTAAA